MMRKRIFERRGGARSRRHGLALLQMAIALSLLNMVVFGVVEFGQHICIRSTFEAAARDAARAAELHYALQTDPAAAATHTLATAHITFQPNWMTITDQSTGGTVSDVSAVPVGDTLTVAISATYSQVANAVKPLSQTTGAGIGNSRICAGYCTVIKQ